MYIYIYITMVYGTYDFIVSRLYKLIHNIIGGPTLYVYIYIYVCIMF